MNQFVAYLDILGTKDLVTNGEFDDLHVLDFSGASLVAALQHPACRFATFSDCVIFTIPENRPSELIQVLVDLFENWLSDGIYARGGVALGEAFWVDRKLDEEFRHLRNYCCSRIYGIAVTEAVEIERSSGPGILPFTSDTVAERINESVPNSILRLSSNVARSFQWTNLDHWIGVLQIYCDHATSHQARRHISATKRVYELFRKEAPN